MASGLTGIRAKHPATLISLQADAVRAFINSYKDENFNDERCCLQVMAAWRVQHRSI